MNRRKFINNATLSIGSITVTGVPMTDFLSSNTGFSNNGFPSGNRIPTLTGWIRPEELGTTLMHEHILWFSGTLQENPGYAKIPQELQSDSIEFAISLLNDAARVGIDTIVDLTPHRSIELYDEIAKKTSVNIIVSTGFYRRSKIPKWKAEIEDEGEMEDLMLKEINVGIEGTKKQAGIIKIAQEGLELTEWEKKVFRAAARVSRAKSIPIATHTGNAFKQFDFLLKAGANPNHIFFSHVDVGRKGKPGELLTLAREGSYLQVDTFMQDYYTPKHELLSFLRSFCDAGFANKVFISLDSNWHWENGIKIFEGAGEPNFDPNAANRTFSSMITDVVPMLLKAYFSMEEIKMFLINNPRIFFSR